MDSERIERLTGQQRVCLRFVFAHLTSKEIAPHLGIEPGSVDQHIKTAMRILGVGDRRTAARLLAEYEGLTPVQSLAYQPLDIASTPDPAPIVPANQSGRHRSESSRTGVWKDQADLDDPIPPRHRWPAPLPIWGGTPNDLDPMRRLGWVLLIMLLTALTFGAFLAGLDALSRLGGGIS